MFFRKKRVASYEYLQIVENYRDSNGKTRQKVIHTLGNLQEWRSSGKLDSLLESGARLSEKLALLTEHKAGRSKVVVCRHIGPDLIFRRLWNDLGIGRALKHSLKERRFQFDIELAVYQSVLHRLFESGSDRSSLTWRNEISIPDIEKINLHHLYRAMDFLGEPIEDQGNASRYAPRCNKDEIEEIIFENRRDLFTDAGIVFFDTTSIYFEGEGGESIGQYGNSKDHRPDLKQMVVGVVVDSNGIPLCCEMWPGNTADVSTLKEVVKRFQSCFGIKDVCIVADRGMISKEIIEFLESAESSFSYILGVRFRLVKEIRDEVLFAPGDYMEIERPNPLHTPLKVREVIHKGNRYIICHNESQARKDAYDREVIVNSLKDKLKQGDKSLVGNKGYRKYLKASDNEHFEIDEDKIASEERFDGKWVLSSNTSFSASEIARQYKQLWMVENIFRTMKSSLDTRPIFHKVDNTIRGHVFCSFLAILLRRELERRLEKSGYSFEWEAVLKDLLSIHEVTAQISGKTVIFRSELLGHSGKIFQAAGVAIPPTVRFIE